MGWGGVILTLILLAAATAALVLFNGLVRARNLERAAWADIDVQLRKRHDLVPALVESVRGYRIHEAGLFENLAATRASAQAVHEPAAATAPENALTQQLRGLFVVVEAYPELKADENFRTLSAQLVAIENDLQFARRFYNGAVRDFRNATETFPGNLIAGVFGFRAGDFFEIETATERSAPRVEL